MRLSFRSGSYIAETKDGFYGLRYTSELAELLILLNRCDNKSMQRL